MAAVGETLRIERVYEAPASAVFDAWTSEEVLRRWFHSKADWTTSEASVDLRVGGAVRLQMRESGEGEYHGGGGVYTEVDPPTRLAFTWIWDDDDGHESLIEIDFKEADGRTKVRFTHAGLRDEASVLDHEGGWKSCFDNLDRVLADPAR